LKRTIACAAVLFLVLPFLAFPQSEAMVSAEKFFADVSASYSKVKDYVAAITITQGKGVSRGRLSYKSPVYLHIDFDDPAKQVINFDGEKLTVYLPGEQVVLQQQYKTKTPSQIEGLVSNQTLGLLQRNYSVAYLIGPQLVPLEDGSKELVTKLKLTSRATTSYAQMIISVKNLLIRRVEGTQASGDKVVMDFANILTNQGVPDSRFAYDSPPYANVIQDWLFDPEE
jgi:outer membrane lipoprotein-sorting protein